MTDIKSKEERSRNMSAIRSKDTKPEIFLRKQLFSLGLRYRNNVGHIVGHPDIYLAKYNTAIFVNGCFWHRHKGCKYACIPKSRVDFWNAKFSNNIARDAIVREQLANAGIKCLVVWECTINEMARSEEVLTREMTSIVQFLNCDELFKDL